MTPRERRVMFVKGFGDGAKGSAMKHKTNGDYIEGYSQGRVALQHAASEYGKRNKLPPPTPLRVDPDDT